MGSAADTKGNYKPQGGCNSVWPSSYPGVQFQLLSLHTENPFWRNPFLPLTVTA